LIICLQIFTSKMHEQDHYLTMSITSPGPATLPPVEKRYIPTKMTNDVSDIEGARSQPKYKVYLNKPQFLNSDIPGSTSKQLIHGKNTRDNNLYIDDIEGTRRTIKDRMMRTNRHVNPLEPNYPLPSFIPVEPVIPPFRRDVMDTSDIDGTKAMPERAFTGPPKDTMNISDIAGASPGLKHQKLLATMRPRDFLNAQDVCARTHRHVDRTHRVTDPCQPTYTMHGMVIADDNRSKPKQPPKYIADGHLLQTKDISGAVADTRSAAPFVRREFRNTNFIGDIQGAKADTIMHSIHSNRMSNPLQPVYQSLDPGELLLPVIPPLVPADLIKIPTLPPLNREKALAASLAVAASKSRDGGGMADTAGGLAPESTWGGATTGNFQQQLSQDAGDLDPVLFTSAPVANNSLPPSGRRGGSNNNPASNPALTLPLMPSMPNSGRNYNNANAGPTVQFGSGRKGFATSSPLVSGRNYGQLTPSQTRQRQAEIDMVRSLN
jgi:hypothetical protein